MGLFKVFNFNFLGAFWTRLFQRRFFFFPFFLGAPIKFWDLGAKKNPFWKIFLFSFLNSVSGGKGCFFSFFKLLKPFFFGFLVFLVKFGVKIKNFFSWEFFFLRLFFKGGGRSFKSFFRDLFVPKFLTPGFC